MTNPEAKDLYELWRSRTPGAVSWEELDEKTKLTWGLVRSSVMDNNPKSFVWYDTHEMTKSQEIAFFQDCDVGDLHSTNISSPGNLCDDQDVLIYSIGLHLAGDGLGEQQTQQLMAHFILTPTIGESPYTNVPGTLCSLFGYPFLKPIAVRSKPAFRLKVSFSAKAPVADTQKFTVRAFLFGLKHRTHG